MVPRRRSREIKRGFLTLLAVPAVVALAACGNSSQQPQDIVDDRSSQSPYGTAEEGEGDLLIDPGNDETTTGSVGDFEDNDATDAGVTPIATGAEVARSATFGQIAGQWAVTAEDCAGTGVYDISAGTVVRPGRVCTVAELIDAGEGSVTAALLCPTGPDDTSTEERELLRLSLEEDVLNINLVGTEDPPTTLERCAP